MSNNQPKPRLHPEEKARCKVCLINIVVAQLLTKLDEEQGAEKPNPAVQQCTIILDELLEAESEDRRAVIIARLNKARQKITKKGSKVDVGSALIAALEVYTEGLFAHRPGTRLDYIISNFKINLPSMKRHLPSRDVNTSKFKKLLLDEIKSI